MYHSTVSEKALFHNLTLDLLLLRSKPHSLRTVLEKCIHIAMQFSFTPICSLPPENTRFTSTPNVRSTLDIVWTCFSILLLCTWSVQHLNIQPHIKARAVGQYIRLTVFLVKRKAKWMLLTLMAPEILIGLALSQFIAARHGIDTMQELACEDGVEWTMEHSHFA